MGKNSSKGGSSSDSKTSGENTSGGGGAKTAETSTMAKEFGKHLLYTFILGGLGIDLLKGYHEDSKKKNTYVNETALVIFMRYFDATTFGKIFRACVESYLDDNERLALSLFIGQNLAEHAADAGAFGDVSAYLPQADDEVETIDQKLNALQRLADRCGMYLDKEEYYKPIVEMFTTMLTQLKARLNGETPPKEMTCEEIRKHLMTYGLLPTSLLHKAMHGIKNLSLTKINAWLEKNLGAGTAFEQTAQDFSAFVDGLEASRTGGSFKADADRAANAIAEWLKPKR